MYDSIDVKRAVYTALSQTGSTWLTAEDAKKAAGRLGITFERFKALRDISCYEKANLYTLKSIAYQEGQIAQNLMNMALMTDRKATSRVTIETYIRQFEKEENHGMRLHIHQKDAVAMVVNSSVSILTGGPGTGKTTVLRCIAYVLRKLQPGITIGYAAPTGKAAQRCRESTGEDAMTAHRKLGLGYDTQSNDPIPVYEDVLFMDESSMNDTLLTAYLSKAVKAPKRLVFVGDVDQLPSVGVGAVLRDLIASRCFPVTMLTHTFRQDNESGLFANIQNVKNGKAEMVTSDDFKAKLVNSESDCMDMLVKAYLSETRIWGRENVVCLLPYRRRGICSNALNNQIQMCVNPNPKGITHTDKDGCKRMFKVGDPVMQLKNRPECVNGDVGKVIDISDGVLVRYDEEVVQYKNSDLEELSLAYAMSIHKSQGSEYASVIMALMDSHKAMLQRNLVYTGITRAKKKCELYYQKAALEKSVATIADNNRITCLAEMIKTIATQYQFLYGYRVA